MVIGVAVGMGLAFAPIAVGGTQGSIAPLWRGVSQIVLVCGDGIDPTLCDAVYAAARARTALPVARAAGLAAADAADRRTVLLAIAAEQGQDGRQLVAVARRAVEIDEAEAPARQAVAWPTTSPALAVDTLLARILPRPPGSGQRSE